jgi:light-regulated signal transduction histidine kinase (bacteriophytochrome)
MLGETSIAPVLPVLDLSSCDREPIHLPGAIQPHGILLGFSPKDMRVTAVSENAGAVFGADACDLLNRPLSSLLDPPSFEAVAAAAPSATATYVRFPRLRLSGSTDPFWRAGMQASDDTMLLEAEMSGPSADLTALEKFEQFQASIQRLNAASDPPATRQVLAEEIRSLTGYDRVKIYRFAPDWSGEVVAEAADSAMSSYLGLHFPASDIPPQARTLYARNPERQIPDIQYQPVPLLLAVPGTLDLSAVGLRSVSPLHIAYLRNMGVGASMSVSIMQHGRLSGMVACHHRTARYVSPELRQASVLLAQLAATRLSLLEEAEVAHRSMALKAIETALLHQSAEGSDYRDTLIANGRALLTLLDAAGLALCFGGSITSLGETPTGAALDDLLAWLATRGPELLATDHLAAHYPPAAALPLAAGILSVPLGGMPENHLVWFRPEVARTVTWAGDPIKPVEIVAGQARLTPRRSFAAWVQQVQGRSRPWTQAEIAAANGLRDTIVEIIVRRALDLERMNTQLARSNEELEAFAYVASHDLKEPLRQIETFSTLLKRAFDRKTDPGEKVDRWFKGIQTSSQRLRNLISDLTEYSRLGGQARPFEPTDLQAMLQAVLQDLDGRIHELGATIEVGALPIILCDGMQMRQVIQNLLANALKYHHPDRPCVISISAQTLPAANNPGPFGLPVMELQIEDNGIGFEPRHNERIFGPFERLHSSDAYEGSGLGLAICRKIVERHGGTITASGRPGEGATFVVTLPLRPSLEQKVPYT